MTLQQFAVRLMIPAFLASVVWAAPPAPAADSAVSYKLLATNKTKTVRKEMNEAAMLGYRFSATMAGEEDFRLMGLTVAETTFGGQELVSILMLSSRE